MTKEFTTRSVTRLLGSNKAIVAQKINKNNAYLAPAAARLLAMRLLEAAQFIDDNPGQTDGVVCVAFLETVTVTTGVHKCVALLPKGRSRPKTNEELNKEEVLA